MRLLANENFPRVAILALRELGHDVSWVAEGCPSVQDQVVLDLAVQESRVLLTLDKDFGELAFRQGLPATCGIVLFRMTPLPSLVAESARLVFAENADFVGKFVVVEHGRIRERRLPEPK